MYKTDKPMYRDHHSIIISIDEFDGLETLGTGLDNNKTTLCLSKSVQHGPNGSMIKQDTLIQDNRVGQPSANYSMMAIDRLAVISICIKEPWGDKGQQCMEQSPPLLRRGQPNICLCSAYRIRRAANAADDGTVLSLAVRAAG